MISFIVPAYNARKTIKKCLDSILRQKNTKLEYEIIVVDDGSTDDTAEFIKKNYSSKLLNIKIRLYSTKNHGLSSARNYGVKRAQGDYIIFVDSDDYLENTLLHDIEEYLDDGIELVKWKTYFTYIKKGDFFDLEKEICPTFEKCTGEQGFNKLFGKAKLIVPVWDYCIKKSLVKEFPNGRYHEDFRTMPFVILNAKSMISIGKFEYHYVQSNTSIMGDESKEKDKLDDLLENYDDAMQELDGYQVVNKENNEELSQIVNEKFDVESKKVTISKETKSNLKTFLTYSLLAPMKSISDENRKYFKNEIHKRKATKNIKIRGPKSLVKRIILDIKY